MPIGLAIRYHVPMERPDLILSHAVAISSIFLLVGLLVWHSVRRVGWRPIALGGAGFIGVQILHVGALSVIASFGVGTGQVTLPLTAIVVINAVILGTLAGTLEETGRFLLFSRFFPDGRQRSEGISVGVGWGGVEAVLVAIMLALSLVNVIVLPTLTPEMLLAQEKGITAEQRREAIDRLEESQDLLDETPWHTPLIAAVKQVFALVLQIALSLLVLKAVSEERLLLLFAAFIAHAAVDTGTVLLALYSTLLAEGALLLVAMASVVYILGWRVADRSNPA